jgi:hypothetical protein
MPTAGDQLPGGANAIMKRLASLEREVKELRAARRAGRTTIDSGGEFIVEDTSGHQIFAVGKRADGTYGVTARRPDGSMALNVNDSAQDNPDQRMVQLLNRAGRVIAADDAYADRFLGRPAIPVAWQPTENAWSFTGTSLTTGWYAYLRAQCPVLYYRVETTTGTASTASLELGIWNLTRGSGYVAVDSWTAASAATTFYENAIPLDGCDHFDELQLRIRHMRSAGASTVTTRVWGSTTRNTFKQSDVPATP